MDDKIIVDELINFMQNHKVLYAVRGDVRLYFDWSDKPFTVTVQGEVKGRFYNAQKAVDYFNSLTC